MTATTTRPTAPSQPARPAPPAAPVRHADDVATLALTLVTLAVVAGFARLFIDLSFAPAVLVTAVTAHLAAWWSRRRDLSTGLAALVTAAASGLAICWTVLLDTTTFGIPTPGTLREASFQLSVARATFAEVVAPTLALEGFVLAIAIAVAIAAFMADWAAFRLGTAVEACIPSFTLFVFTAALGTPRYRAFAVAAWGGAVLLFQVAHRLGIQTKPHTWFGGRAGPGPTALVASGAVLGAVAVIGGLLVGPSLPGAGDDAVIAYRERQRSGRSNRTTISPLVDIRGRLVDHSGVEVFTVRSNGRSYWRLTSLDTFNGSIWRSDDTYRPTEGRLPSGIPQGVPRSAVVQEYSISALASIWLPAAYEPRRIESEEEVSYNAEAGSLITEQDTTDGQTYAVLSELPTFDPARLAAARPIITPELAPYLSLPAISDRVRNLALRVTARASTPYEKALALQSFFRNPRNFTYDLRITQGHDGEALERFLFTNRRGYCEQFAGAYGVLARAAGLPTRLAVGFTPGELQPDGLFHVRDEHAHAWPEVWLDGAGWVAFEPTPGRGRPGAEEYTGLEESQDTSGDATTATTATTAPPTTAPPAEAEQNPTPSTPEPPTGDEATQQSDGPTPLVVRTFVALVSLLLLFGLWLLGVAAWRRRRRNRRLAQAASPAGRVRLAWLEATEALSRLGWPRRPAETPVEYATRVIRTGVLGTEANRALQTLAAETGAAVFAADGTDEAAAARAEAAATVIGQAARDGADLGQQVKWALDPRPPITTREAPARARASRPQRVG